MTTPQTPQSCPVGNERRTGDNAVLAASLLLMTLLCWALARLSYQFADTGDAPVFSLVAIGVAAGVIYLIAMWSGLKADCAKRALAWMIAAGILMRLFMFFSSPILEDDYYRYLWDGASTAHGMNPFAFAPESILDGALEAPQALLDLAGECGTVLERINHPELRTIYPPMAQASFAIAYWLNPWSFTAWRVVLLLLDFAILLLLVASLRALGKPAVYAGIYWCNPLLVKEIFNSGHMDSVAFPFVVAALLLTVRRKYVWAFALLALAVGAKVWPAALAPVLVRYAWRSPKKLLPGIAVFALISGAMFAPIYLAGIDPDSGFHAYSRSWQNNDSIFRLFVIGSEAGLKIAGYPVWHKNYLARYVLLLVIGLWVLAVCWRPIRDDLDLWDRCLWITAGLFLLSPTQFPWYSIWLLPFLAVRPRVSLLLLTVLMPLYYLRYWLEPRGMTPVFKNVVVWIEFAPVWIALIIEFLLQRKKSTTV